jgi:thioredoxin 1
MVTETTDKSFEEDVLKSNIPVVVDLWAPWCGPCRMVAPLVEKLSGDYQGKVKFYKLNVDQNPDSAARYHVMSIPTLLFFKEGKVVDTVIGAVPERTLKPKVDNIIQVKK